MPGLRIVRRNEIIGALFVAVPGLASHAAQADVVSSAPCPASAASTGMKCEGLAVSDPRQRQQDITGKPPRIEPLAIEEMGLEAQAIADRIRSAAGAAATGEVPEMVGTMLRHSSLYAKHVELGTELLGNGALSPRHRELAILRTGWLLGAPYEWGEHVAIGKRAGLTEAEIERVIQGSEAPGWNAEDRAVIRAAEELRRDAMISDSTWAELATFLDARQLIELPYLIGNYTKVAYLQNALRFRLRDENAGLSAR